MHGLIQLSNFGLLKMPKQQLIRPMLRLPNPNIAVPFRLFIYCCVSATPTARKQTHLCGLLSLQPKKTHDILCPRAETSLRPTAPK